MKELLKTWRTGILTAVPLLLITWIFYKLGDTLISIGNTLALLVGSQLLGITIVFAIVAGVPLAFGWFVGRRWFRTLGQMLLGKLPLVGPLFNFLFNHDYVERIQKGDLREVMFQYMGDTWTIGGVMNEIMLPERIAEGPLVPWLVILAPPTAPLAVTAPLLLRKKSTVHYTGRTFRSTLLTVASFGFNFDLSSHT